jgi:hypothetical protein
MLSKKPKEEVISIGVRNRASYLLEQYGYTMGVAKLDGDALVNIMPAGYLDEIDQCADRVREAMKNKTLVAAESKSSTQSVNQVMRLAKEWRRAAVSRGKVAKRTGYDIPDELIRLNNLSGVPSVMKSMHDMIKLIEANKDAMASGNLQEFIDEGKTLVDQVTQFDSTQEVKRLKSLPDTVREFYYQKGLLYIGIKGINDYGRAFNKGDAAKANAYHLSILYRHAGKRKPDQSAPAQS